MSTERSERRPSNQLFPVSPNVATSSRGAIRYMYRERYDKLKGHLQDVYSLITHSEALELSLNNSYESLISGNLKTWYTIGLTAAYDCLAAQFRSHRSKGPKVIDQDLRKYWPLHDMVIPEDWFLFPPEELEILSDRLRNLLIGTDDQLHNLTNAMREFYIDRSGEVSPRFDMAYLSGIADVYIPSLYAYDRERAIREED